MSEVKSCLSVGSRIILNYCRTAIQCKKEVAYRGTYYVCNFRKEARIIIQREATLKIRNVMQCN
jgi:hypothetical protein